MYVLYGGGVTRSVGAQMVLEEAGLDYELRPVDPIKGEHRTPEFLALNPAGLVPALETPEGPVLHEVAGIMVYLADRHRVTDLAPAPDDPLRGTFLSRIFYVVSDIEPHAKRFFYAGRFSSDPADAPRIKAAALALAMERWSVLDRMLADNGPYNLGDRFSLADLLMAMWANYGLETTEDIVAACPAVRRCTELVIARPKSGPLLEKVRRELIAWQESTGGDGS
ncbi:MAG: glutathione S-transferase family protein [Pseudomonadota bacterium]